MKAQFFIVLNSDRFQYKLFKDKMPDTMVMPVYQSSSFGISIAGNFKPLKICQPYPSGVAPGSLLSSFSFLNSNLPNFQVKLIPIERIGTLRSVLTLKFLPDNMVL